MPSHPGLTRLVRAHLARFGADVEGRVFHADHGGEVASITYTRAWDRVRRTAFTRTSTLICPYWCPYNWGCSVVLGDAQR